MKDDAGASLEIEFTFENSPWVPYDVVAVPGGEAAAVLTGLGQAVEFVQQQYCHWKTILVPDEGVALL